MDDLAVFLAVSRTGGFRMAARWLNLSPSTVSETVSRLEERVGVPLFTRTTRSVHITEAGRALADRVEPVMSEARAALDEAASSKNRVRGHLKLNVPGAVMFDILPPLIDGFLALHPDIQIEVMVDDRLIDITAIGCDAGIRYGEHLAQDMIAVPIGPHRQWVALAASPAYLEKHGAPQHPRDILAHDCIHTRFASGALVEWEFERDGKVLTIEPPARIIMGAAGAAASIDLAMAGRGMVYTFRNWLEPQFNRGSLVPVLSDWWPSFDGPNLYFSSRFVPTALRAFLDFIAEQRASTEQANLR